MGCVRRPRRAAAASWLVGFVAAVAAVLPAVVLVGAAPAAAAGGQVRLVRQTPWVVPGQTLSLALRTADVTDPKAVELAVTVHPAVKSRVELARSDTGEGLKSPIWPRTNAAVPLSDVPAAVDGTLTVQVPTRDPKEAPDSSRATLSQPGIYPVQVELRQLGGGDTVHRFTTHLLAVKGPADGTRLNTAVVLPLSAPPSTGLVGAPAAPPAGTSALADAAMGLTAAAPVPVTLVPTPEVLSSLAASAPATAAVLQQALAERDVLGRTFVPVDVPGLGAAAASLLPRQQDAGREAARAVLGREPIQGTWLADDPLDGPALAQVVAAGSSRMVLPQHALGPTGPAVPAPLHPVTVAGGGATATGLVADDTLAAHLDGRAPSLDQPLAAHHLLADLAAIATLPADQGPPPDQSGGTGGPGPLDRGVATVLAARAFTPTSAFLSELLGGLSTSPVLKAVDLAAGFALAPEPAPAPPRSTTTRARRGTTTTLPAPPGRTLLPLPADASGRDIGAMVTGAASQLSAQGQVLADPAAIDGPGPDEGVSVETLQRRLLVATSADLPVDQRRSRLKALIERATTNLNGLQLPEGRTLRLTARTGQLPVGIFNTTGRTAKVLLQLDSDKLEFPNGNRIPVVLDRRTTTSRILVRVRASGGFPVKVRLLTPDGGHVLQERSYVVRADTFPGVAIAVSGAAAVFLAAWWARTLLAERGRRRHGLHRAPRVSGRRRRGG